MFGYNENCLDTLFEKIEESVWCESRKPSYISVNKPGYDSFSQIYQSTSGKHKDQ